MAAQLGEAWWTVMDQVIDRGTHWSIDPARLAPADEAGSTPVTAVGVDETRGPSTASTGSCVAAATTSASRCRAGCRPG
jgi:hypothetical protein